MFPNNASIALLSKHRSFPNSQAGIATLIAHLPADAHVCLEPTGGYERPLVNALHAASLKVSVVNPKRIRDFVKSQGFLAKNDKADAFVLAAYATSPKCPLTPPARSLRGEARPTANNRHHMNVHNNARLLPRSRAEMVKAVEDGLRNANP